MSNPLCTRVVVIILFLSSSMGFEQRSNFKIYSFLTSHSWRKVNAAPIPGCVPPTSLSPTGKSIDTTVTFWRPQFDQLSGSGVLVVAMKRKTSCYVDFWGNPKIEFLSDYPSSMSELQKEFRDQIPDVISKIDFSHLKLDYTYELFKESPDVDCRWLSTHEMISTRIIFHTTKIIWSPSGHLVEPRVLESCRLTDLSCPLDDASHLYFQKPKLKTNLVCLLDAVTMVGGVVHYSESAGGNHLHNFYSGDNHMVISLDLKKNNFNVFCRDGPTPIILTKEGLIISFAPHKGVNLLTRLLGTWPNPSPILFKARKRRTPKIDLTKVNSTQYDVLSFPQGQRDVWLQERVAWSVSSIEWSLYNLSMETVTNFVNVKHSACQERFLLTTAFKSLSELYPLPYLSLLFQTHAVKTMIKKEGVMFKIGVPVHVEWDFSGWRICNRTYVIPFSFTPDSGFSYGFLEPNSGFITEVDSQTLNQILPFCLDTKPPNFLIPLINGLYFDVVKNQTRGEGISSQAPHLSPYLHLQFPVFIPQNDSTLTQLEIQISSTNEVSVAVKGAQTAWNLLIGKELIKQNGWFLNHLLTSITPLVLGIFLILFIVIHGSRLLIRCLLGRDKSNSFRTRAW